MKKILRCLFIFAICLSTFHSYAQYRYLDEVFTDVTVESDVKYGENYSVLTGVPVLEDLLMDVYMPDGDTEAKRPLVIIAHSGSFLPAGLFLPFGTKGDSSAVEMCTQFAKRGWVAVAMNYRIGWNPLAPEQQDRAGTIMTAVYRSAQDARTCVRFFQDDAANANTYMVDPTKITVGGSNSGGYTALAVAYLDKVEEINLFKFQDSLGNSLVDQALWGGFYGEGGTPGYNNYSNPGHSSEIQLVFNLGGAIGDTSWMEAGDIPVVAFHGEKDVTTPYLTDIVIVAATGMPVVEVSGSYDVAGSANSLGLNQGFIDAGFDDPYTLVAQNRSSYEGLLAFPGLADGFEPWAWYNPNEPTIDNTTPGATGFGSPYNPYASKPKALTFIDTIMGYFVPRAVLALGLETAVGIENSSPTEFLHIYPNPTNDMVTIQTNDPGQYSIEITSLNGQLIHSFISNRASQQVNLSPYPKGVYFITVRSNKTNITEKIIKY